MTKFGANKFRAGIAHVGIVFIVVLTGWLIGCSSLEDADSLPEVGSRTKADVPVPRSTEYEWMSIARWYRMHADDVEVAQQGDADILFIGDSITESWGWEGGHEQVFEEFFGNYRTANFGIGGDQTQNLLWRLQNGLAGTLDPKVVVILIGVNNFNHGGHSAYEVFAGVEAVVDQVRVNYPDAKILLNGIFPFNESAASPSRPLVQTTNRLLERLNDGKDVVYRDFGEIFLDDNGNIVRSLMEDFLHPSPAGMRLFAKQIEPIIAQWVAESDPAASENQ